MTGMRLLAAAGLIVSLAATSGCDNRVSRANKLLELGSTNEARELLQEERKANPTNAEAHFSIGRVYEAEKDADAALAAFDSATKASSALKDKVGRYCWQAVKAGRAPNSYAFIRKAFELCPALAGEDEASYVRYVRYGGGPEDMQRHADRFPKGLHAAATLSQMAGSYYSAKQFTLAKVTYERLARDFRHSPEGEFARSRLDDWWEEIEDSVRCDHQYRTICAVSAGQEVEMFVSGDIVLSSPFGDEHINAKDVRFSFGDRDDVQGALQNASWMQRHTQQRMQEHTPMKDANSEWQWNVRIGQELAQEEQQLTREWVKLDNSGHWRGTATRSGSLWMGVDITAQFDRSLAVRVRYKPVEPRARNSARA